MDDQFLINTLIIMAGIESKQPGAMPLEDNTLFVAANRLKELETLKAQVERIETEINAIINDSQGVAGYHLNGDVALWDEFDLLDILQETPAQCLAEIKAQAVIDAINAHKNNLLTFDFNTAIRVTDLIQYANQLRQQAAKEK